MLNNLPTGKKWNLNFQPLKSHMKILPQGGFQCLVTYKTRQKHFSWILGEFHNWLLLHRGALLIENLTHIPTHICIPNWSFFSIWVVISTLAFFPVFKHRHLKYSLILSLSSIFTNLLPNFIFSLKYFSVSFPSLHFRFLTPSFLYCATATAFKHIFFSIASHSFHWPHHLGPS